MGDIRTTIGEKPPLTQAESRAHGRRVFLWTAAVFAGVLLAGFVIPVPRYAQAVGYVTTEDYAEVHSPVTGVVSRILVGSGVKVQAGQLLVQMNAEEEEATLAEARSRHSRLQVNRERRKSEIDIELERRTLQLQEEKRHHADEVHIAQLKLDNAKTKRALGESLVERGLKAAIALEDERLKEEVARVSLESLQHRDFRVYEELLQRDREKYRRELDAMDNEVSASADAVRRAEARLRIRQVRAPIAGTAVRYEFVVGELMQPSGVMYEIFGGEKLVLKLRVPERYAEKVGVGQKYRARLNSYKEMGGREFTGEVLGMRNIIQGDGERNWRTAYCSFDAGSLSVAPGTTAEAKIRYGRSCFWKFLLRLD